MSTTSVSPLCVGLVGYRLAGAVFHAPFIATADGLVLDTGVTANLQRRAAASSGVGRRVRLDGGGG